MTSIQTKKDERKVDTVASFYRYSDLSVETMADQLDMDVDEVQKIIDGLAKEDALEIFVEQSATTLEKIMTRNVFSLDFSKTASDAARLMNEKEIGSVVVTSNGKPFGIVTERDIVRRAYAKDASFRDIMLEELASRPLIFAEPTLTVEEAAEIMTKNKIRRLPVVDGDKLIGIVTITDLAAFLSPSRRPGLARSVLQAVSRAKGLKQS